MLKGLDKAYWAISSMLLIRKFLKFPKMLEIHKMPKGLIIAHWLKSSMLLIRKFLKFPKILKCQLV